jgi:preprotein translocase subunit SecG
MAIVSILILVVFVVSALLLMAVVLIQDDQGGGIGSMFGGGSGTPFGARTGNVLTRLTTVLAVIFLVAAFTLAWMNRSPDAGNVIGRARAERLRGIERTDWWVETPQPELFTQEQAPAPEATAEPAPATDDAGAAAAGEATASDQPPAAESTGEGAGAAPSDDAAGATEGATATTEGGSSSDR